MKRFITTLLLILLYITICSNSVYAQLPFEPFAAYTAGNPVISSIPGTWDEYAIWPSVIFFIDTFYITYSGTDDLFNTPTSIGLAISSDGFTYAKNSNPIFSGDGNGFDAYNTGNGILFFNNQTWYLYYTGRSAPPNQPGNIIGRAMSNTGPHGPWIRSDDTLLAVGSPGEWDSEFIGPEIIVENGAELIMYYWAGDTWPAHPQIGLATSIDGGLTWEKYNDPTTTAPPYVESDPVLKPDKPYDMNSIWGCTVLRHDTFWEMFYSGSNGTTVAICYATSWDGINWQKDSVNNPIFTPSQDPIATNIFEKPGVVIFGGLYFMYYDYYVTANGIGLATAEVITSVELWDGNIPLTFSLEQNYPNPFNPTTTIEFALPTSGSATLNIFNVLGELGVTLVSENLTAGNYKYEWNATELTSGMYFYRLQAGTFVEIKKMVLMK